MIVSLVTFIFIREKQYEETYQTACALSDIVRILMDQDTDNQPTVFEYISNMDCYSYDIDSINFEKYG